jgi:hypothetical protein
MVSCVGVEAITEVRRDRCGNPSGVTVAIMPTFSDGWKAILSESEKLFLLVIRSFLSVIFTSRV